MTDVLMGQCADFLWICCNYRKLKKFDDEVLWNNIKEGVDENGKKMDTGAEERD